MILFTKFRTDSLDHMKRGSNVVLRKETNQKMTIFIYACETAPVAYKQLPRRFGARCDDAHHCEQNGVVFEANFFAKVIEVYPPALELCTAWAS